MIRKGPNYKKLTANQVLGKIINHKMMENEAKYVDELADLEDGVKSSKPNIALKASKKGKQVVEENSSDNESVSDLDQEEMALIMRKFNKLMKSVPKDKRTDKHQSRSKRNCYNCGKSGHFISNFLHEKREDKDDYKKEKRYHKGKS